MAVTIGFILFFLLTLLPFMRNSEFGGAAYGGILLVVVGPLLALDPTRKVLNYLFPINSKIQNAQSFMPSPPQHKQSHLVRFLFIVLIILILLIAVTYYADMIVINHTNNKSLPTPTADYISNSQSTISPTQMEYIMFGNTPTIPYKSGEDIPDLGLSIFYQKGWQIDKKIDSTPFVGEGIAEEDFYISPPGWKVPINAISDDLKNFWAYIAIKRAPLSEATPGITMRRQDSGMIGGLPGYQLIPKVVFDTSVIFNDVYYIDTPRYRYSIAIKIAEGLDKKAVFSTITTQLFPTFHFD